jgi:CRP-like cAMP-binding protein
LDIAEQLQDTTFFQGIDSDALAALVAVMKQEHFEAGRVLFEKDDPGDAMYIILNGAVRIYIADLEGNEFTIRTFHDGDLLGEFTLLDEDKRSASAQVMETSDILTLYRDDFMGFLNERPTIGLRMMRNLSSRIRYTTTYLQTVVNSTQLLGEGNYHDALANISDSPNPDIHNLVTAFKTMIERVQQREEELQKKARSNSNGD